MVLCQKKQAMTEKKGHEMLIGLIDDYSANPEFYFYKAVSIESRNIGRAISVSRSIRRRPVDTIKAMKNIEKAIHLNPDLTDGYMVRGIICHLKGDNDEAISNFREVTERGGKSESLQLYSLNAAMRRVVTPKLSKRQKRGCRSTEVM